MVTQREAIERLKEEGVKDLTVRTLTHWRSKHLLPPLIRVEGEYLWDFSVLKRIKLLCHERRTNDRTLFIYEIDGCPFDIIKVEIARLGKDVKMFLFVREGGFVMKSLTEKELKEVRYAVTS